MNNQPNKEELEKMAADIHAAVTSLTHRGVRDPKAFSLLEGVRRTLIQKSF